MPDKPFEITLTQNEKDIKTVIFRIRKRIKIYLIIICLTGIISFLFLKLLVLNYNSTATFYLNNNSVLALTNGEVQATDNPAIDNFNRVFEMVNSETIQRHLITTFDLMKHYNIDTTKEFAYQKAVATIRENIIVRKNPFNTISVTVTDKYRYLCADIANEIVSYIDKMNQEFYSTNFQKRADISHAFLLMLEKENHSHTASIDSLINKVSALIMSTPERETRPVFFLEEQERELSSLLGTYQNSTHDLILSQKLYALTFQMLNFKNFPTIQHLELAMPAFRSTIYQAAVYSLLCMILVATTIFFVTYLTVYYGGFYHRIFSSDVS